MLRLGRNAPANIVSVIMLLHRTALTLRCFKIAGLTAHTMPGRRPSKADTKLTVPSNSNEPTGNLTIACGGLGDSIRFMMLPLDLACVNSRCAAEGHRWALPADQYFQLW